MRGEPAATSEILQIKVGPSGPAWAAVTQHPLVEMQILADVARHAVKAVDAAPSALDGMDAKRPTENLSQPLPFSSRSWNAWYWVFLHLTGRSRYSSKAWSANGTWYGIGGVSSGDHRLEVVIMLIATWPSSDSGARVGLDGRSNAQEVLLSRVGLGVGVGAEAVAGGAEIVDRLCGRGEAPVEEGGRGKVWMGRGCGHGGRRRGRLLSSRGRWGQLPGREQEDTN
ncbi:hypothetical protein HD554DRAFT_2038322 [Boletus coccyginus]|nr:hypothetical protein HD554DRAFT_2038322 [Boletus coccyginus]